MVSEAEVAVCSVETEALVREEVKVSAEAVADSGDYQTFGKDCATGDCASRDAPSGSGAAVRANSSDCADCESSKRNLSAPDESVSSGRQQSGHPNDVSAVHWMQTHHHETQ